jgi:predicted ATPase
MFENVAYENGYDLRLLEHNADRFIVVSGCSGAGKSSLIREIGRRGFQIFEEAGRQIVKEQLFIGGDALPWNNMEKFVEISIARSMHHMIRAARSGRLSFFDRGIVDQIGGLEHAGLRVPEHLVNAARRCRYHNRIFVTPPWKEIFETDEERRHDYAQAAASYDCLLATYKRLGYETVEIPKANVETRADFVLAHLPPM